jgi:UDP-glucuronate decarboxylase
MLASTSEIYGDPVVHPQPESYWGNVNTLGPRACYDEGKRCAETLFMNYHDQNKVKIKIARIFNTYGPRMSSNDGRVVSNFIVQALKGEDLTIFGDGSHTRSFQYIDDLVEGLIKLMATSDSFIGPVNLGNPVEVSVGELARIIIKMTHSKSKITWLPLPEDDPKQRKPDITLAKKELGWQPVVGLEEGLGKTIEYFRSL